MQTFTWTFSATASGPMQFSISTTGIDAYSGATVFAGSVVAGTVQAAAHLVATVSVSATQLIVGSSSLVTVTVVNSGEATAFIAAPPVLGVPGSVLSVTGPWPSGPVSLSGGTFLTWSWTVVGVGGGDAGFTMTVTGIDINSNNVLNTGVSVPVFMVERIGLEVVSLSAAPGAVRVGEQIAVILTVRNTGTRPAAVSCSALTIAGDGGVWLLESPVSTTIQVGSGATAAFRWVFRGNRGGTVTFACGARSGDGLVVAPVTSSPVRITEAGQTIADLVVYPNPFRPGKSTSGVVRFRHMPPFSKVSIYTIVGEPVISFEAGVHGYAEWDARNRGGTLVTPGVYIYIAKAPDGGKKIGKIQVAP
jgi:hypothetical protein